jgi:hypothetical protein
MTSCFRTIQIIWEPLKLCKPIPPPGVLVIVPNSVLLFEVRNSSLGVF